MIKGIVSAVPRNVVVNDDEAFIRATGVKERRIATAEQDVLTLAEAAARRLMTALDWGSSSIEAIVFVTQTPVYRMPAMACVLAGRLGVTAAAFDINQACSGYIYGLAVAGGISGRVLVVTGDTVSKMAAPDDKLFGDCVAVTAIENGFSAIRHGFGTDGGGYEHLIADPTIRMNGVEVMNFALRRVPELVAQVTMNANVDFYLFHQANRMILNHIGKKCALPMFKVPINIEKYGNTSSASIPLLICDSACTAELKKRTHRVALFGFGAGWSWGGVMLDMEALQVAEVVEV